MRDDEVQKRTGVYEYILTGDEKYLNLRVFPDEIKEAVNEQQGGVCNMCRKPFKIGAMQGDHILAWSQNGKTIEANCQMLCRPCNASKGGR